MTSGPVRFTSSTRTVRCGMSAAASASAGGRGGVAGAGEAAGPSCRVQEAAPSATRKTRLDRGSRRIANWQDMRPAAPEHDCANQAADRGEDRADDEHDEEA